MKLCFLILSILIHSWENQSHPRARESDKRESERSNDQFTLDFVRILAPNKYHQNFGLWNSKIALLGCGGKTQKDGIKAAAEAAEASRFVMKGTIKGTKGPYASQSPDQKLFFSLNSLIYN